jgi:GNAT superfamily N-acetyltransferase
LPDDSRRLIEAMHTIESLLSGGNSAGPGAPPYTIRTHRPGDVGWVIGRHGVLYCREYGWGERFEALVAEVLARFLRDFDATRERCWIAEIGGNPVGSVFLMKETDEVAKLRMLLVEPEARGLGIGARLVNECILFAREKGYRTLTLWTQANLDAAQHIYEKAGFRIAKEEMHQHFGVPALGRTWALAL